jgi:hypothetical protein
VNKSAVLISSAQKLYQHYYATLGATVGAAVKRRPLN